MAIQQGIRHFINEINGHKFIVFMDHRPIIGAFKSRTLAHDPVTLNQIQEIAMWTTVVRYLAGKVNTVADLLSRYPPKAPAAYQIANPANVLQSF